MNSREIVLSKREPVLLTIAGTDPLCGAGCAADLATFAAFGWVGTAVETAFVTQDSHGVRAIACTSPDTLEARLRCVGDDCDLRGIKIGMLGDRVLVDIVTQWLSSCERRPVVVLDPVGASDAQRTHLFHDAFAESFHEVLPYVDMLTPNAIELSALTGITVSDRSSAYQAAQKLHKVGVRAVLIKGGHVEPLGVDELSICGEEVATVIQGQPWPVDIHGTGCHLSSAITACLARGQEWTDAAATASAWLHRLVAQGAYHHVGTGRPQFDPRRLSLGFQVDKTPTDVDFGK